jgi:hypothetical protein
LLGNLIIQFKNGLKVFDSTKVHFLDGGFQPIKSYLLVKDSTNTKLTISTKWALDSPYILILEKSFGEDSSDRRLLKDDTIKIRTKKESDYGSLLLRFKNLDISKHPVLQFVQNKEIKFSYPLKGIQFEKQLFPPGDYDLRILYDDNGNGVWDPGEFFGKHRQPEKVSPVIIPMRNRKRVFTVKANWENEYEFNL